MNPTTWTPERNAVLDRDWPGDVELNIVLERINALPGPAVTKKALRTHVAARRLTRSDSFVRPGHLTLAQHEEIRRRSAAGQSHRKIGAAIGISRTAVGASLAREAHLLTRPKSLTPLADKHLDELRRLLQVEVGWKAVCEKLGVPEYSVRKLARRNGLKLIHHAATGAKGSQKPLNDSRVSPKMGDMQRHHIYTSLADSDKKAPAAKPHPEAQSLHYDEIIPIAKRYGCWDERKLQFDLQVLNPKLIADGYRPLRIRPWQLGARELPARELRVL